MDGALPYDELWGLHGHADEDDEDTRKVSDSGGGRDE